MAAEAFGTSEDMFRQTFKFKPGNWLLMGHDATGLKAVPVPIQTEQDHKCDFSLVMIRWSAVLLLSSRGHIGTRPGQCWADSARRRSPGASLEYGDVVGIPS